MSHSITQLYGDKLGASDGEIGEIKDFYFDDQQWVVRYLVADTGTWLPRRQVLLSPHSLGQLDPTGKILGVNLTRKQIEDSPPIETHKPVSRQYEEEYYRYFGWPYYWQGNGLWGLSGFPILELPDAATATRRTKTSNQPAEMTNAHLSSTKAVTGYRLQATDGMIGQVCDFLIDPRSWAMGELVVKIGNRFSGKEVEIPTAKVERISWDESTVFVRLTKAEVEAGPVHPLPAAISVE